MRNPIVKKGDTVFIVCENLDSWNHEDTLIYTAKVQSFEKASSWNYGHPRVILSDGNSADEWFLSKQEAKKKILAYIKSQFDRLECMQNVINQNEIESRK